MIKNKIYYLLLGIGLGIIISSSMNIAFNKPEKIEYSDEEIKEKAKSLGMISIKENIEKNDKEKTEKVRQETQPKTEPEKQPVPQIQSDHKTIVIDEQDTASSIIHKLKTNEVIKSEEEFRKLVVKFNLQRKFRKGTYEVKTNLSYAEVLKILIKEHELKSAGFL